MFLKHSPHGQKTLGLPSSHTLRHYTPNNYQLQMVVGIILIIHTIQPTLTRCVHNFIYDQLANCYYNHAFTHKRWGISLAIFAYAEMYAITEKVLVKFDDLIFITFSYFGTWFHKNVYLYVLYLVYHRNLFVTRSGFELDSKCSLYNYEFTLIPACISHYMHYQMWDEITYPCWD